MTSLPQSTAPLLADLWVAKLSCIAPHHLALHYLLVPPSDLWISGHSPFQKPRPRFWSHLWLFLCCHTLIYLPHLNDPASCLDLSIPNMSLRRSWSKWLPLPFQVMTRGLPASFWSQNALESVFNKNNQRNSFRICQILPEFAKSLVNIFHDFPLCSCVFYGTPYALEYFHSDIALSRGPPSVRYIT